MYTAKYDDDDWLRPSAERSAEIQSKLHTRLTLDEAVKRYEQFEQECLRILGTSGGWLQQFEREIRSRMIPNDEIRLFQSTVEEWAHLCGEQGLALVRNGIVVNFVLEGRN